MITTCWIGEPAAWPGGEENTPPAIARASTSIRRMPEIGHDVLGPSQLEDESVMGHPFCCPVAPGVDDAQPAKDIVERVVLHVDDHDVLDWGTGSVARGRGEHAAGHCQGEYEHQTHA